MTLISFEISDKGNILDNFKKNYSGLCPIDLSGFSAQFLLLQMGQDLFMKR